MTRHILLNHKVILIISMTKMIKLLSFDLVNTKSQEGIDGNSILYYYVRTPVCAEYPEVPIALKIV